MEESGQHRPEGRLLAASLATSWRESPDPLEISPEEFVLAAPAALKAGGGALLWRRIAHMPLASLPAAAPLREAWQYCQLRHAAREQDILTAFGILRGEGIEPILLKGWAAARLYADPATRPAGDIDLLVAPAARNRARRALESSKMWIDLDHVEMGTDPQRNWEMWSGRSVLAPLGDAQIRVLGPEDHLRHLCMHALRHIPGDGLKPLWLCDVAAAIERWPEDGDWERCLGTSEPWRGWIRSLLALSGLILGTDLAGTPVASLPDRLPGWLPAAILREWADIEMAVRQPPPSIGGALRHPDRLWEALAARFHDPLQASVRLGVPFGRAPRLPLQLAVYGLLAAQYLRPGSARRHAGAEGSSRSDAHPTDPPVIDIS